MLAAPGPTRHREIPRAAEAPARRWHVMHRHAVDVPSRGREMYRVDPYRADDWDDRAPIYREEAPPRWDEAHKATKGRMTRNPPRWEGGGHDEYIESPSVGSLRDALSTVLRLLQPGGPLPWDAGGH